MHFTDEETEAQSGEGTCRALTVSLSKAKARSEPSSRLPHDHYEELEQPALPQSFFAGHLVSLTQVTAITGRIVRICEADASLLSPISCKM